jgi:hypothetical protein
MPAPIHVCIRMMEIPKVNFQYCGYSLTKRVWPAGSKSAFGQEVEIFVGLDFSVTYLYCLFCFVAHYTARLLREIKQGMHTGSSVRGSVCMFLWGMDVVDFTLLYTTDQYDYPTLWRLQYCGFNEANVTTMGIEGYSIKAEQDPFWYYRQT